MPWKESAAATSKTATIKTAPPTCSRPSPSTSASEPPRRARPAGPLGSSRHDSLTRFVSAGSYGQIVNRTDRLYALVEELRACAPRRRSARQLASLYEVSARTIERDIGALQQAGVPIYADAGRSGGYTVDKSLTLPPLNFSPAEVVAVAVALAQVNVGPFAGAARSAVRKIVAAMSRTGRDRRPRPGRPGPAAGTGGGTGAGAGALGYRAGHRRAPGAVDLLPGPRREPHRARRRAGRFMAGPSGWYLVGWCRVRDAARCFRVDRIKQAGVRA